MKSLNDGMRRKVTYAGIRNAIIAATFFLFLYMLVVILTTPSLSPLNAVTIAVRVNGMIISGMLVGIAIQSFLVTYSKQASCSRKMSRTAGGVSATGSAISSFLSFFTLVPLGCCGTWLYIISFLPGILGTGVSGFIVQYSRVLSLLGFILMGASIIHTYISIKHGSFTALPSGKKGGNDEIQV